VIAISLSILIAIDCLSLLLFYWNKKVINTPFCWLVELNAQRKLWLVLKSVAYFADF